MFGKKPFPPIGDLPYLLTLGTALVLLVLARDPTGTDDARRVAAAEAPLPMLHAKGTWESLLRDEGRPELVAALRVVMRSRGWLAATLGSAPKLTLLDVVELAGDGGEAAMVVLRAEAAAVSEIYVVPIAYAEGDKAARVRETTRHALIAEVEVTGKARAQHGNPLRRTRGSFDCRGAARRDGAPAPATRRRRRGRADPDRRVSARCAAQATST